MNYSHAGLRRGDWRKALRVLARTCGDAEQNDTADHVRALNDLIGSAPDAGLLEGLRPILASRLEALLRLGAGDSAILAMLGEDAGYLLSRSGNGRCLATVILTATSREETEDGATPALALVAALAMLLANVSDLQGPFAGHWPAEVSRLLH